jgi:hypothetical protein
VGKRAVLGAVVVVGVATALLVLALDQPPEPATAEPTANPELFTPAPVAVARLAAVVDPGASLQRGFCPVIDERFKVKFSLVQLINTELANRADGGHTPDDQPTSSRLAEVLGVGDVEYRLYLAKLLAWQWPNSVLSHAALALVAREAEQPDEQLAALRRARSLAPTDPAVGWDIAAATLEGPDLEEGIDGLTAYLRADPSPVVSAFRARLLVQRELQMSYQRLARNGVTLLWPAASLTLSQAEDVARAVDRALDDAATFTGTRRRARLTVVVYPGKSELLAVTCSPSWTGGSFDGTLRLPASDGPAGVDLESVRHEALHAQLTPLAPTAPTWFHEGVAQSFARETAPRKWRLMVKNRVWVPFSSLEGTFHDFEAVADAELAYAQSYAMVEFLRAEGGIVGISIALAALAAGDNTETALTKACGHPVEGAQLLSFIEQRLEQPSNSPYLSNEMRTSSVIAGSNSR